MIGAVLAGAAGPHAGRYRFAEQVAMPLVPGGTAFCGEQKAAVDALYETVKDRDRFNSAACGEALGRLRSARGK